MKRVVLLLAAGLVAFVLVGQQAKGHDEIHTSRYQAYLASHEMALSAKEIPVQNEVEVFKSQAISITLDSIRFKYYDAGAWNESWKYMYTYNGSGQCITEDEWEWNGATWDFRYRYAFTYYYPTGNLETMIISEMNAGILERQWKTVLIYNSNNQLIEELEYNWDNNQWEPSWRMTVHYDNGGKEVADTSWQWDNAAWVAYGAREYTYDSNDLLIERVSSYNSGTMWYFDMKKAFEYNSLNQLILELEYGWNNNNWEVNSKDTIAYDANGFMNLLIDYYWDNGVWQENDKIERTNDAIGNILTDVYSVWDNSSWAAEEKIEAQYEASTLIAVIGAPYWFTEEFKSKIIDHTYYEYSGSAWEPEEDADLYYSSYIEVPVYNQQAVKVYPNPVNELLVIESANALEIEIFNLLGERILHTKTNSGKCNVNMHGLSPGIYLVSFNRQKTIKITKL